MPNKIFLGEFKDRQLETEYLMHENAVTIKYIRPAVLFMGILFFLFIIPDYYLTETRRIFQLILVIRSTFLVLVILLYLHHKIKPDLHYKLNWISAYEFIVSCSFLLIYYFYETPNICIQSFGAVALILIFFHLGNRWSHALLISLFLGFTFIMITLARPEIVDKMGIAAISVYITLFTAVISVSAYRINIYKRLQFLNTRELQLMSETDSLTGIYTRRKFDREAKTWIDLASRHQNPLSVILFDIDNLKDINDTLGHLEGDKVLTTIVSLVKGTLRKSDIFARWGGDEFAILLPNTDISQAYELAERLNELVRSHRSKLTGPISCSFGVEGLHKGDTMNSLFSRVDLKLYQAKICGKNKVK